MRSSTSPTSELTVLLWGNRWWLPHSKVPLPFSDASQAAATLAEAWREPRKSIRLIYQPEDLVTVPTACPNGSRATLRMALAEEHQVVLHPGHVWSHEPVLAAGEGFMTLLHYESRPALFGLVQQLQERGFTVNSAWPLATWLNALPPELSESGAMTVCAVHPDAFCLYRQAGDGQRLVQNGHGPEAVPALAAHLRPMAAQAETEYVLYITTSDELVDSLNQRVPINERQVMGVFYLWDALAKAAPLPPHLPAQLLPPVPRITPRRAVAIATLALMLGAILSGVWQAQAHFAAAQARLELDAKTAQVRAEVEHLRANAAEIARLRTELAVEPGLPAGRLLDKLAGSLPPEVVLRSVRATAERCILQGWVDPSAPAGLWPAWLAKLNNGGPAQWPVATPPSADGAFQIEGRFPR